MKLYCILYRLVSIVKGYAHSYNHSVVFDTIKLRFTCSMVIIGNDKVARSIDSFFSKYIIHFVSYRNFLL